MNSSKIRTAIFITAILLVPAVAAQLEQSRRAVIGPASDATQNVTFTAVGDIMLDRGVGDKIKKLGAEFPFESVAELLSEADLTLGNLESPISSLGKATKGKEVNFRATPQVIKGIRG